MNRAIKNKVRMYQAVNRVVSENQTSWSALPAFESVYITFSEKLAQLVELGASQTFGALGITNHKQAVRRQLVIEVDKIGKALRVHAMDNSLFELNAQLKFSRSDIEYGPELAATQIFDFVLQTGQEFINELVDYGITQARIDEAVALKDEFKALSIAPRDAIVKRKEVTRNIGRLSEELETLLKDKLDSLVFLLENTAETFVHHYRDARIILDRGKSHKRQEGESDIQPEEPDDGQADA